MLLLMALLSFLVVGESEICYFLFWAFCGELFGDGSENTLKAAMRLC